MPVHYLKYCLFYWLFLGISSLVMAQETVIIPDSLAKLPAYNGGRFHDVTRQLHILRDQSQQLTYPQVKQFSSKFIANNTHQQPLEHFESCWVKITLQSPITQDYFLYFPSSFDIDVFVEYPKNKVGLKKTGYHVHPSQKDVRGYRKHFVRVLLQAQQATTLYIHYKMGYRSFFNAEVLLSLYPAKVYETSGYVLNIVKLHEVFIYIWVVLMVYNGLLFLIIKERLYLIYTFYIFTWLGFSDTSFHLLSLYFTKAHLVPVWIIFVFLYCSSFVVFLQHYLKVKEHLPRFARINRLLLVFFCWVLLYGLIDFLLAYQWVPVSAFTKTLYTYLIDICFVFILISTLIPFLFFLQAVVIYRKGYKPASWYIAGSFILLFSVSGYYIINYVFTFTNNKLFVNNVFRVGQQIGFTLEMMIFSIGIGYRYNSTQKAKQKLLQNQNKLLEEQVSLHTQQLTQANYEITRQRDHLKQKNKDIMDSINYARYIQQAFLPQKTAIQALLPESFIFFKPKEVVSGDFYWFAKINRRAQLVRNKMYQGADYQRSKIQYDNSKVVIVAADCTGHGVAGALMSMVGNDALNKIVLDRGIVEADKILNLLNFNILQLIYNQEARSGVGMDVSLAVIDQTAKTIEFAGALSSLVVIQNGELRSIKGDIFPVGGIGGTARRFSKHLVDISVPTTLYLFSDGFRDQFGGEAGKKFSTKRFYKLLHSIHTEPMSRQEAILKDTMFQWMESYDQLDDMLVMGLRVG
ncbi:7TM diverse intracellular signaling domain-containing protein [uncultured Microscilla sp.]|uniref:7TM diverse intracellular signaling domain-containing protein n=1 Tax=uncultured Microscilla sp. TaxID=432653 RepID=UPI00261D8192|nr:7TM diverse intracellular signaling domain-containing protein [uncultured Microscilla sp.]